MRVIGRAPGRVGAGGGWLPAPVDALLAVVVAGLGAEAGVVGQVAGHPLTYVAAPALATAGVVLWGRRRWPGACVAGVAAVLAVLYAVGGLEGAFPAVLLAGYSGGLHTGRQVRLVIELAAAVVAIAGVAAYTVAPAGALPPVPTRMLIAAVGAWLVGRLLCVQFRHRRGCQIFCVSRATLCPYRYF